MLNWPEILVGALAGAVLGAGVTAIFWGIDHRNARATRVADVRAAWSVAAHQIEMIALVKGSTSSDLYREIATHPIDDWRRVLGRDDFQLLEQMQNAWYRLETATAVMAPTPADPALKRQWRALNHASKDASVAFINRARELRSESYQAVTAAEHQRQVRTDYRRHPIQTFKRERHNRRVRREAAGLR